MEDSATKEDSTAMVHSPLSKKAAVESNSNDMCKAPSVSPTPVKLPTTAKCSGCDEESKPQGQDDSKPASDKSSGKSASKPNLGCKRKSRAIRDGQVKKKDRKRHPSTSPENTPGTASKKNSKRKASEVSPSPKSRPKATRSPQQDSQKPSSSKPNGTAVKKARVGAKENGNSAFVEVPVSLVALPDLQEGSDIGGHLKSQQHGSQKPTNASPDPRLTMKAPTESKENSERKVPEAPLPPPMILRLYKEASSSGWQLDPQDHEKQPNSSPSVVLAKEPPVEPKTNNGAEATSMPSQHKKTTKAPHGLKENSEGKAPQRSVPPGMFLRLSKDTSSSAWQLQPQYHEKQSNPSPSVMLGKAPPDEPKTTSPSMPSQHRKTTSARHGLKEHSERKTPQTSMPPARIPRLSKGGSSSGWQQEPQENEEQSNPSPSVALAKEPLAGPKTNKDAKAPSIPSQHKATTNVPHGLKENSERRTPQMSTPPAKLPRLSKDVSRSGWQQEPQDHQQPSSASPNTALAKRPPIESKHNDDVEAPSRHLSPTTVPMLDDDLMHAVGQLKSKAQAWTGRDPCMAMQKILCEVSKTVPMSVGGTCSMPLPGIVVHPPKDSTSVSALTGTMRHPLSPEDSRALSTVGELHVTATMEAPMWQFMPQQFNISNPAWSEEVDRLADKVLQRVGMDTTTAHPPNRPRLYKMLLSGASTAGSVSRMINPDVDGIFCSLWLFPPATYTGGEIVIKDTESKLDQKLNEQEYDFGSVNGFSFGYVCLFGEAVLNLHHLLSGERLALVYTIAQKPLLDSANKGKPVVAFSDESHLLQKAITEAAGWSSRLRTGPCDVGTKTHFLFVLQHAYDAELFGSLKRGDSNFKGRDARLVHFLKSAIIGHVGLDWDIGFVAFDSTADKETRKGAPGHSPFKCTCCFCKCEQSRSVFGLRGYNQLHCFGAVKVEEENAINWYQPAEKVGGIDGTCLVVWPRSETTRSVLGPNSVCQNTVQVKLLQYLEESTERRFTGDWCKAENLAMLGEVMDRFVSSPKLFQGRFLSLVKLILRFEDRDSAERLAQVILSKGEASLQCWFVQKGLPPLFTVFGNVVMEGLVGWFVTDIAAAAEIVCRWEENTASGRKEMSASLLSGFVEAFVQMTNGNSEKLLRLTKSLGIQTVPPQHQGHPPPRWPILGISKIVQLLCRDAGAEARVLPRFVGAIAKVLAMDTRNTWKEVSDICRFLFSETEIKDLRHSSFPESNKSMVEKAPLCIAARVLMQSLATSEAEATEAETTNPGTVVAETETTEAETTNPDIALSEAEATRAHTAKADSVVMRFSGCFCCEGLLSGDDRRDLVLEFVKRVVGDGSKKHIAAISSEIGCDSIVETNSPDDIVGRRWPAAVVGAVLQYLSEMATESSESRAEYEKHIREFFSSLASAATLYNQSSGSGSYDRIISKLDLDGVPKTVHANMYLNAIFHSLKFGAAADFAVNCLEHNLFQAGNDLAPDDFILNVAKRVIGVATEQDIHKLSVSLGESTWSRSSIHAILQHLVPHTEKSTKMKSLLRCFVVAFTKAFLMVRKQSTAGIKTEVENGSSLCSLESTDYDLVFNVCTGVQVREMLLGLLEQLETDDVADFAIQFSDVSVAEDRSADITLSPLSALAYSASKKFQQPPSSCAFEVRVFLRFFVERVTNNSAKSPLRSFSETLTRWSESRMYDILRILCRSHCSLNRGPSGLPQRQSDNTIKALGEYGVPKFLVTVCREWARLPKTAADGVLLVAELRKALETCGTKHMGEVFQPDVEALLERGQIERAFSLLYIIGVDGSPSQNERCARVVAKALKDMPSEACPEWTPRAVLFLFLLAIHLEHTSLVWAELWNTGESNKPTIRIRRRLLTWDMEFLRALLEVAEEWWSDGSELDGFAFQFCSLANGACHEAQSRFQYHTPKMTWGISDCPKRTRYTSFLTSHCRKEVEMQCSCEEKKRVEGLLRTLAAKKKLTYYFVQPDGSGGRWFIRIKKKGVPVSGKVPACSCNVKKCPLRKYHEAKAKGPLVSKKTADALHQSFQFFSELMESQPSPTVQVTPPTKVEDLCWVSV